MKTIILKDDDVLENEIYTNVEFGVLIKVEGDNVVIDNILVNAPKKDFHRVIQVTGKNCHIKNCRFSDFSVNGCVIVVEHKEEPNGCIIENNLFYGGLETKKNNGLEAIRLGESKTSLKGEGKNIIFRNRFENWDREMEIISVKNSNNLIVNNEVINCKGTITLRHGKNNIVCYNFIDGKNKKDSGGIRVCDDNHTLMGNILYNIQGNGLRSAISLMCGVKNSPLNRYLPINKCFLLMNTLFNCKNALAFGMKKKEANIKPHEVYLQMNTFIKCENLNSNHKDNIGAHKIIESFNITDAKEYKNKPKMFIINKFDSMKKVIIDYTNKEMIKVKTEALKLPDIEEEKGDFVITDDDKKPRYVDIDKFMDKLTIKLQVLDKMNQFRNIQKKMEENVNEHRKLMDDLKKLMSK